MLTSFYSCKKEDLSSDPDKSETNLFEKNFGFIDYKTLLANIGESTAFKSNSQFFEKIDYANKGARFMDAYIDTETIHMIEGATVNFYTLKIINNNPEERTTTFYNLVFQEDLESGEVTSCILQYSPELSWLFDKSKNFKGDIVKYDNQFISIEEVLAGDMDINQQGNRIITCPFAVQSWYCPNGHVGPWELGGNCGGHYIITIIEVPCGDTGGGGGDGGGEGGGGSSSGSGSIQTIILEICDDFTHDGGPGNSEDCEDDYAAYFIPYICDVDYSLINYINNWAPSNQQAASDLANYLANNFPEDDDDNCAELDLEYVVILDQEFIDNDCLYNVYEDMGKAPTFNNYLQNFDGTMSVANLRFSVGADSTYPNANAVTYPPENYLIEIKFNPNRLNRPPLDVARTFIHEMIHAEIYRKLLSLAQQGAIPWSVSFIESIRNDYPGLHDYYMRYQFGLPNGIPPGDPQHEMMAEHYRDIVIDAMKEYDNSFSNEIYEALSWMGLMGSGPVNQSTGLPPNPTTAWANLTVQERLNIISVRNSFIANNSNCE